MNYLISPSKCRIPAKNFQGGKAKVKIKICVSLERQKQNLWKFTKTELLLLLKNLFELTFLKTPLLFKVSTWFTNRYSLGSLEANAMISQTAGQFSFTPLDIMNQFRVIFEAKCRLAFFALKFEWNTRGLHYFLVPYNGKRWRRVILRRLMP